MSSHSNQSQIEQDRATSLLDAQNKALKLFEEIERDLIRPDVTEKTLSDEIHQLATERYNLRTHWHKRVIRSGPNTLCPFAENPPDRTIESGDLLYVDLGPVFEQWEADFGRTYVLGNDEHKIKVRDLLEPTFNKIKAIYKERADTITGEELYNVACEEAKKLGYDWGSVIAGHLIGDFPHERIPQDKISLYITPGSKERMSALDKNGNKRHWILEVHLEDKARGFRGFYEQLLTVD